MQNSGLANCVNTLASLASLNVASLIYAPWWSGTTRST